jgi:uncharacterized membrane protein
MRSRRLRRIERAAVYGLLGTASEVVFTAVQGVLHRSSRSARLEGHTYLWMPPIYALCAVLYEPLHDRLRGVAPAQRAAVYAAGFIGVEYVTGRLIERVAGVIPWDYTGATRLQVHGATRLDYAPLWAAAGMALEPVDDALRALRVGQAG